MQFTKFGRELEAWEYNASEFCDRGDIPQDSPMGQSIWALSEDELKQLSSMCDPAYDDLTHVDNDGFSFNHGSVGTLGIRYDFR